MRSLRNQNILIVGCGYVGQRLATELLPHAGISGIVRSLHSTKVLKKRGINPLILDLDQPIPTLSQYPQQIYYFAPPPNEGRQDTRIASFLRALNTNEQATRIVYLGTTGVYGDCKGEWVNETHPLAPTADRALRRRDAENQLTQWQADTGNEIIILRVAGIYGPGKLPLARLRQCKPMIAPEYAPWTNRIHVEDLVQVCIAAMKRGQQGAAYNVSDGQPGNMADYFNQVADALELPRPPIISPDQATAQLSAGLRSYLAESRRIDNSKMLVDLGVTLKYPSLARGLVSCLPTESH